MIPKNLKKRSIVWQIKNTKTHIPDFRMLINPSDMSFSLKKIISRNRTYGGFVEEHWGNDLNSVQANGKTAMFYNNNGLTVNDRRESESMENFNRLLDMYRNNATEVNSTGEIINVGRIVMILDTDTRIYEGFFESFSIHEEADDPFVFAYDFSFKILKSFGGYALSPNITPETDNSSYFVNNMLNLKKQNKTDINEVSERVISSITSKQEIFDDASLMHANKPPESGFSTNIWLNDPINKIQLQNEALLGTSIGKRYIANQDAFNRNKNIVITPPQIQVAKTTPNSKLKNTYELGNPSILKFQNSAEGRIDPVFAGRLAKLAKDYNLKTKISEGFRTEQQQQKLYNLAQSGKGNPANAPGTSWHQYGEAVDWSDPILLKQATIFLLNMGYVDQFRLAMKYNIFNQSN